METNWIVHSKHYKDGYPLCWDQDKMGIFEGSYNDAEVTCPFCLAYLQEE